jgi:hypothetical protein
LVNPVSETVEILMLPNGRWTVTAAHVGAVMVRAEPFEAIELDLAALWDTGPADAGR